MKQRLPLLSCLFLLIATAANAQQYVWAKNGGSAATLNSGNSMSINSANEIWIAPNTTSLNQFKDGAGAITTNNGIKLAKFDANLNLVWNAPIPTGSNTAAIAADPDDPTMFYVAFHATISSGGIAYGATTLTGQAAASTTILAKCQTSGTGAYTYIWARKIDGTSDDQVNGLKVRKIAGVTKIAVGGYTRSPKITNYGASSVAAQEITLPAGGGSVYDQYISCYDGAGTPLWINTFGAAVVNEIQNNPMDINDDGDVVYAAFEGNSLGSQSYIVNNSSGVAPGTLTGASYTANAGNQRFILFNFKSGDGSVQWAYDRLTVSGGQAAPMGITTDAAKNVYLEFNFNGNWHPTGVASAMSLATYGSNDIGVVVVDNTGTPVRAQHYGGTGQENTVIVPNGLTLDRTNNLLYMGSQTATNFTNGTATVSGSGTWTGFLLSVNSTGAMAAVSAVSLNSSVAAFSEYYGSVGLLSTGEVIGVGQYGVSAGNSVNGGAAVMPKTAYGYGDIAMTKFAGSTLVPTGLEAGWGARVATAIQAVAMQGSKLISGGNFNGTMVLGSTTITAQSSSAFIAVTDTSTGNITAAYNILGGSNSMADMKVNPTDGSIYMLVGSGGNILPPGATTRGNTQSGGKNQVYLTKLSSSYAHQWTVALTGTESTNPVGLSIDPAIGDIYITGNFTSPSIKWVNDANVLSADIATNSNTGLPISQDVFVAKFNSAGIYQWITTGGNPSNAVNDGNSANKGIVFSGGSVYAGFSSANNAGETFSFGGQSFATAPTASNGASDMALVRLNAGTGTADWIKNWGGGSALEPITGLGVYGSNVYVAGYSSGNISNFGAAGSFVTAGSNDAFVFAVDAATGTEQAIPLARIGGNGSDGIFAIDIDALGNIFYIGTTSTTTATASFPYVTSGGADWLTGSLEASTLTPKFTFVNGSVGTDGGNGIVHGKQGTLFTGGYLLGNANFGATTLSATSAGEYAYARIDYPYIAPGAALSNLNAWYKANALLTGSPATAWTNSSVNSSLTTVTNPSGTVPVNAAGSNYNPTLSVTGGSNYLSQSNIYSPNFLDASGTNYTIYSVYKPSANTDQLAVWNEGTTGTGITIGAGGNSVTGIGGLKTAANTTALSTSLFSLSSITVTGGTLRNYLNGAANGTQAGITALSTTNPGTFKIDGTGNMEVAEVVTYGTAHTTGQRQMTQVDSYFGIKYGITLPHAYTSTIGDTLFKADGAGATYTYDNNIAGIGIDSNEVLIQKQGRSQNTAAKGNMLAIGLGTIAADNVSNTSTPGAGISYLVWGDDAASVTTTQTTDMPASAFDCAQRLPREWKINRTGTGAGTTQITFDLSSTITLTGKTAADFKLLIDADGDGNFATGAYRMINATSFSSNIVTFDNVAWDSDLSGSDVFTLVTDATATTPTLVAAPTFKATNKLTCVAIQKFVDPASAIKKYMQIDPNTNTGYNFTVTAHNDATQASLAKTDGSTYTSAISPRMFEVLDAGTNSYTAAGGMKVRIYYDPADIAAATAALDPAVPGTPVTYWFKKPGVYAAVAPALTPAGLTGANYLTPVLGTENGVNYAEFSGIKSFSTFGIMVYKSNVALPVKLSSFTGTARNCNAALSWKTESEISFNRFEVEQSTDNIHYNKIATVAAHGTGSTYAGLYSQPQGTAYYRLKMVDNDGRITYSDVVPVKTNCTGTTIEAYPNPVKDVVTVTGLAKKSDLRLMDVAGRTLTSVISSNTTQQLDMSRLAAGTYLLQVVQDNQIIQTIKIVKN